jgi:hypothetical protein
MSTALKINRGTTFSMRYVHQHDGVPVNITNAKVYFTVKPVEFDALQDDSSAIIKVTGTIVDGPNGVAAINLTPVQTSYILGSVGNYITPGKNYVYDIKVDENGDQANVYKTVEGKLTIDASPNNRAIM